MKTIEHGVPSHKIFAIAQPDRGESYSKRMKEKPEFILQDKQGQEIRCQFIDCWRFDVEELEHANALCMLAYGQSSEVVSKALLNKYPELHVTPKVELLLLKRL